MQPNIKGHYPSLKVNEMTKFCCAYTRLISFQGHLFKPKIDDLISTPDVYNLWFLELSRNFKVFPNETYKFKIPGDGFPAVDGEEIDFAASRLVGLQVLAVEGHLGPAQERERVFRVQGSIDAGHQRLGDPFSGCSGRNRDCLSRASLEFELGQVRHVGVLVLRVDLLDVLGQQRRVWEDPVARLAVGLLSFVDFFMAATRRH